MRLYFLSSPFFGQRINSACASRSSLLTPSPEGRKGEEKLAWLGSPLCCAQSCPPVPAASPSSGYERAAAVGGVGTSLQGAGSKRFTPRALRPSAGRAREHPAGPRPSSYRQPPPRRREKSRSGEGLGRESMFRPTRRPGGLKAPVAAAAGGVLRARGRPPSPAAVGGFSQIPFSRAPSPLHSPPAGVHRTECRTPSGRCLRDAPRSQAASRASTVALHLIPSRPGAEEVWGHRFQRGFMEGAAGGVEGPRQGSEGTDDPGGGGIPRCRRGRHSRV